MTTPNLFNKSHSRMATFRRLAAMLLGCAFAIPLQAQPPANTSEAQRQQLVIEAGHKKPIADSAISHDGRWVVSYSSQDGEIKIWDAQTGALTRTIQGPPEGRDLRFAPTGKTINLDYRWKESGLRTASYDTWTGSAYATLPLACLQDELLFATALMVKRSCARVTMIHLEVQMM